MSIQTETAKDVLLDAFDDMSVHMDEETLGPSDARTGIKAINRIMAGFAANGLDLGFTAIETIGEELVITDGAVDALVSILAERLWPKYRSVPMPQAIVTNAIKGTRLMHKLGVSLSETEYPSNLPKGSGNYYVGDKYDTFYDGVEEE